MRLVAVDALARVLRVHVGMTGLAGGRGLVRRVRSVAARTGFVCLARVRVRERRGAQSQIAHNPERGLQSVTTHASVGASCDEVVRLVAADTRVVPRGLVARRFLVAGAALRDRGRRGRMRLVTVGAPLTAGVSGVLGRQLLVASATVIREGELAFVEFVACAAVG